MNNDLSHLPTPITERFKHLPSDWKLVRLQSLVVDDSPICYGILMPGPNFDGGIPVVKVKNFSMGKIDVDSLLCTNPAIEKQYARSRLVEGDLLLSIRGSVGQVAIACKALASANITQDTARIRVRTDIDRDFIFFSLQGALSQRQIALNTIGQAVQGINIGELRRIAIGLPSLCEQTKIARILESWDRAIELTETLIAAKKKRKYSFMHRIFGVGIDKPTQLSQVLQRVTCPVVPEANVKYRQIGIRSHGKGIFHKPAVTGASLGTKRVYRIKPDCFVFNVVFAWEQAVARTTAQETGMIASHRFPIYEPIDDLVDIDFLLYFFKTKRGKHLLGLASPGGAGRNRTLSQAAFLKIKAPLPAKTDQSQYATMLLTADREITLLEHRVALLKQQKKGLMQQLLSGKIRVKLPKAKGKK